MSSLKKYKDTFITSLSLDKKKFNEKLEYNQVTEWDSIGHMTLVSDLEEAFNVSFETDDIIDFSSYKKGMEILKKYKINFNK